MKALIKKAKVTVGKSIPKLVKLLKTATSGFFRPLQMLANVTGRWVDSKLYPTYESPPVQWLFEQMMMEYFNNQGGEFWRVFRQARAAGLNNNGEDYRLELAMVVRDYFKLRALELETRYKKKSDGNIQIQLEAIQEVTLQVQEYFGYFGKSMSTDVLDKYTHA